jgi:hypothetical protein
MSDPCARVLRWRLRLLRGAVLCGISWLFFPNVATALVDV